MISSSPAGNQPWCRSISIWPHTRPRHGPLPPHRHPDAIRLTPALIDLFRDHQIQVGVSLDGPPEVQQRQRGRAAETLRGLGLLEAAGTPFRITTVVTRESAAALDRLVLLLAGFAAARGIGLDLLVDKGGAIAGNGVKPVDCQGLERGVEKMIKALDDVNARRGIPLRLRERDRININPPRPQAEKGFCRAVVGESLAVDPAGNLFPCGQTLGDPCFAANTVWEAEVSRLYRLACCHPPDVECHRCDLSAVCPGDCPSLLHYIAAFGTTSQARRVYDLVDAQLKARFS